jgi:hypothetical protein
MLDPYDSSRRVLRSDMESKKVADGDLFVFEELPRKVRIETQIHRRRAAKAFSPLTLEWEQAKPAHPEERMNQEQL